MQKKILGGIAAVLASFAAGFIPEHSMLSDARQKTAELTQQLNEEKRAHSLSELRNSAAVLYTEVSKNNFDTAGSHASKFFTGLRAFTDQSSGPLRERLEKVLSNRDATIASIAKADPGSAGLVQSVFLSLQGL